MLDSSSHSNRCHHDSCQSSQPLNQNGEPIDGADENYHHMDETIKLATGYCHDNLKMDSSSDLSLAYVDRNGNPAILNQQLPCQRPSRSGVSQEQIEHGAAQELSRQEILARISPRATMMSRTLQALPDIPSRNEPIAHQIRRVQSEHLADIQRQWEDQQQRRLQQDQERQLQRDGSYSLESIAISRHAPVTISRFIAVSQPIEPSLRPTSDGLMHMPVVLPHVHEEMHQKNQSQGSNLSYLNYEKDDLQPEECWRRGQDDMVGR
ncbi:hypothetical protein FBU30_007304 [Linnemannia zychae]|nr:hypothetical protein FBU30_007304 [Linnemannia zychae]